MFKIEEKRNIKMLARRGTNRSIPKLFRNGEKRTVLFHKKTDRRGAKRGIPKLFRDGEKRTDLFQKIWVRRGTNSSYPKIFRNEEKRTDLFQENSDRKKTNCFDSDYEEKNRKKRMFVFFWNEGKVEGLRSKKKRGFDIAMYSCHYLGL